MNSLGRIACISLCILCLSTGCRRSSAPQNVRPWHVFLNDRTNILQIASIETENTRLISSYDRSGGNDDYSYFAGNGSEDQWVVLVDLEGPGCIQRLWCTGVDTGHPIRIYFDNEDEPRIDTTIDHLFGYLYPFTPPLAWDLNMCNWSYIPLTYNQAIRIEALKPPIHPLHGPRKLFYQVNFQTYPSTHTIQTFPKALDPEDRATVSQVADAWFECQEWPAINWGHTGPDLIAPGEKTDLYISDGPRTLTCWDILVQPANPTNWTQSEKEALLQDTVLEIYYDGSATPSVSTPLGDFFCNAWRKRNYGTLLLGSSPNGYRCSMPMPFRNSIRFQLVNTGSKEIHVRFRIVHEAPWKDSYGYLHAAWNRSGPQSGYPHPILNTQGHGRFLGCFLALTGENESWWILEGDEQIYLDGEPTPSWHGTGLEDYFNGGWYYGRSSLTATHGVMDRAPFRVAQFRFHITDPITFSSSMVMNIERGDRNVSRGHFKSVAYYYLEEPGAVDSCIPKDRAPALHAQHRNTFMLQLVELERMNNYEKCIDLINEYRETWPDDTQNGLYLLRILEYRKLLGQDIPLTAYDPFIEGLHGPHAVEQAELLRWFHEAPNRAVVAMNSNGKGIAYVDGKPVLRGDHPYTLLATGIELSDGPHILAAESDVTRMQPWMQLSIRTHNGLVGTGPDTRYSRHVTANWNASENRPSNWHTYPPNAYYRGTPDAPFIGSIANAFILQNSKVYSVGAGDWGYDRSNPKAYFRNDFVVPLNGMPDYARKLTGLKE